jgi:hypothetical protein
VLCKIRLQGIKWVDVGSQGKAETVVRRIAKVFANKINSTLSALSSLHLAYANFRPLTQTPLAHARFPHPHSPLLESALRVQSLASKPLKLPPRASQHHTAAPRFADRCLALTHSAVAIQYEPSRRPYAIRH